MMEVLFRTLTGSRLYGLHHADSDFDYYTVVDKVKNRRAKYAKQTIVDGIDSVVVDFGTFTDMCQKGVPQALEACFSQMADIDKIAAWRGAVRVGEGATSRYLRTIKSMALSDTTKQKRHALRLAMNLRVLRTYGRFNPTLDDMQVMCVKQWADNSAEDVYEIAKDIVWEVY